MTNAINDYQIRALRTQAMRDDRLDVVELCDYALDHNDSGSRDLCAGFIAEDEDAETFDITDAQIEALFRAAHAADDDELVNHCRWALKGDEESLAECVAALHGKGEE